jgi:hypothetical protein
VPDPAPNISLAFEWCGLTAERVLQGGQDSYYAIENIDLYICDTTGRYGEMSSFVKAYSKTLSVYIFPGGRGGPCGYQQRFLVSAYFSGTGYKDEGGGNFSVWENIAVYGNLYDTSLSVCYDGSEPVVQSTIFPGELPNVGCNGPGGWDECVSTEPEITVLGAP